MITLSADDIKRCRDISNRELGIVRQIASQVAEATDVPFKAIMGVRRDARTVQARQLVMYIARREGLSLQRIGRVMNRDHTTVLHGIRAEEQRRRLQLIEGGDMIGGTDERGKRSPVPGHSEPTGEVRSMPYDGQYPISASIFNPEQTGGEA